MKNYIKFFLIGFSLVVSSNVSATIYNISFDGLDDADNGNSSTFIQETSSGFTLDTGFLAVLTYDNNLNLFTLGITGLNAGFSIRSLAFNLGGTLPVSDIATVTGTSGVNSLDSVSNGAGQDPPYDFPGTGASVVGSYNFRYDFLGGDVTNSQLMTFNANFNPNCLTSNVCAVNPSSLNPLTFAIYATNGLTGGQERGAWILGQAVDNTTAIPESQTSAMLALGLAYVGFVTRRRRNA